MRLLPWRALLLLGAGFILALALLRGLTRLSLVGYEPGSLSSLVPNVCADIVEKMLRRAAPDPVVPSG